MTHADECAMYPELVGPPVEQDAPLALIREAAALMRKHGPLQERVADWLDIAGADLWAHGPLCECGTGCDACDDNLWEPHARQALLIARHYLGRTRVTSTDEGNPR